MSLHLNCKVSRRNILKGIAAAPLLPAMSTIAAESKTETWALLADTHIHADPAFTSRHETNMANNLKRVVAELLAEKTPLNGVIIDGDCAFNEGLRGDYDLFAKLLTPLVEAKIPIHMTMGNHDDRGPFFQALSEFQTDQALVENKHVGLVESAVANFVFLDSLQHVNKTPGEFGEQQLKWLSETLDAHPDKPTILVGHHYPKKHRDDLIPGAKPIKIAGLIDTDPFMKIVASRKQAKAYIFGHSHTWGIESNDSGFHEINLPPVGYVFNIDRPNGWVKAEISPSGMSLQMSTLDKDHPQNGETHKLPWR